MYLKTNRAVREEIDERKERKGMLKKKKCLMNVTSCENIKEFATTNLRRNRCFKERNESNLNGRESEFSFAIRC